MVPVAGSAYAYDYATLGELLAWIIGWDLVLEYAVASSTVAHGWSPYLLTLLKIFGITPAAISAAPFDFDPATGATGAIANVPAAAIVLLVTIVLVVGIRESARFNAAMVLLKLAAVLFVIVVGARCVEPANWRRRSAGRTGSTSGCGRSSASRSTSPTAAGTAASGRPALARELSVTGPGGRSGV